MSKILDIREQLKKSLQTPSLPTDQKYSPWNTKVCLSNFEPESIEEISKLIRDSPNKSCSLDPIPTWFTKKCIDVLALLIMEIVSKLIEKVIASQLHSHMTNNNLYEELQSSHRKFHSTEAALIGVHDDILRAIYDNKSVLFIMLDLSAAFDSVDHGVLLEIWTRYLP